MSGTECDTHVRDAVIADATRISAIGRVAFPAVHESVLGASAIAAIVDQTYSFAAVEECISGCTQADDAHFLVAQRDGQVVGYLHYDCAGPEPELHRIYVDPEQKRGGIGSALVRELHARLAAGSSYVLLVVAENQSAIAFYRKHGLVEQAKVDGPTYYRETMGVRFPPDTGQVPSLLLRFTKTGGSS